MVATKSAKKKKKPAKKSAKSKKAYKPPKMEDQILLYQKAMFLLLNHGLPGNKRKMDNRQLDIKVKEGQGSTEPITPEGDESHLIPEDVIAALVDEAVENGNGNGNERDDPKKLRDDSVEVQKVLLKSPELEAIRSFDGKTRNLVKAFTLRSPLNCHGIYLIPHGTITMAAEFLEGRKEEREELIEAFMAVYDAQIDEAEGRLGDAFDRSQYPSHMGMRAKFRMTYKLRDIGLSKSLETIDEVIAAQQQQEAANDLQELHSDLANMLRGEFMEVLGRVLKALEPPKEGQKKPAFTKSAAKAFTMFFELFDSKNICDDKDAAAIVQKAKKIVELKPGKIMDSEVFRTACRGDEDFAADVRDSLKKVQTEFLQNIEIDESRLADLS